MDEERPKLPHHLDRWTLSVSILTAPHGNFRKGVEQEVLALLMGPICPGRV